MLEEDERRSTTHTNTNKSLSPLGNLSFATVGGDAHAVSPGDIEFKDPFKALCD